MSKYIKREEILKVIKGYIEMAEEHIEMAEEHMENDDYHEAQFDGFQELQDDIFNLPTIEVSEDAIEIDNIPSVVADRPKEINYTFDYCPRCGMRFLIPTITEPKGED